MKSNDILPDQLEKLLLEKTPFIDVRAPIEFLQGALPGAVNLPILNDAERTAVGTVYKQQGSEAAIQLGHQLISGDIKSERLRAWAEYIKENPNTVLYCFRGGQRSQITQRWLAEIGLQVPLIKQGYKGARNFLIQKTNQFCLHKNILALSGPTGSGKTILINSLPPRYPCVDLEKLAQHRGSAFGSTPHLQPSQINFENSLALELIRISNLASGAPVIFEDESRLIGRCVLPNVFFDRLRVSPIVWVDEDLQCRVNTIFNEYILNSNIGKSSVEQAEVLFQKYQHSLNSINKRLGGLRTQEIHELLNQSHQDYIHSKDLESNKKWIEKLLIYYYDPIYLGSLERRQVTVAFKGSYQQCEKYLLSHLK